ncbi:extensin-like isoform X1 [Amphibalanus amphitrite]|uniref:extensin-like isoform X1 n=1 Tax=Amphibalanus amphitrite TaxID=1232801 RepID=UPI001C917D09|nr:extensin-like isoform X1 [Amphibalanus amphitrite]
MKEISRLGRYGALICLLVACSIAGKRHYNVYREEYYFLKAQVPYTPLQVRLWANRTSTRTVQLTSSAYRWTFGRAVTPVLKYAGSGRYLATLGDDEPLLLPDASQARRYLRNIMESLVKPSFLVPLLSTVFVVWDTTFVKHRRGKEFIAGSPKRAFPTILRTKSPGGAPSEPVNYTKSATELADDLPFLETIKPFKTPSNEAPTKPPIEPPTLPPAMHPVKPATIPTEPPTMPPTEPPTKPPTEPPTRPPTEPPTAPPTEPPTRPPTEPPTMPPTKPPTIPPTEPPTAPPTEPPTKPPTEPPTRPPTEPPTKPPTEPPTEPPTGPPTEPPTIPPTVPPTEPPTKSPGTEPPTKPPTEPPVILPPTASPTLPPTEPPTEPPTLPPTAPPTKPPPTSPTASPTPKPSTTTPSPILTALNNPTLNVDDLIAAISKDPGAVTTTSSGTSQSTTRTTTSTSRNSTEQTRS